MTPAMFPKRTGKPAVARCRLALCLAAAVMMLPGCGQTPQLASEDAWQLADAAWTAVTSRRAELLAACTKDLAELESRQAIDPQAAAVLRRVLGQAQRGEAAQAAAELKKFIKGQRAGRP